MAKLKYTYLSKGIYWRFRRGKMDCPLPDNPAHAAFHKEYARLLALSGSTPAKVDAASFRALIIAYRKSPEFRALADSTQRDYDRTLNLIVADLGDEPFAHTSRVMIKIVMADYADTPRKAHKIKQTLSLLYTWADDNDLVKPRFNPAMTIKRPKTKGGVNEYVVWSDFEIDAYLKVAPPHAVTPVLIALYTGQRREDIAAMTWQQWQGDALRVRQSKTGTLLEIPCHPVLRAHLAGLKKTARAIQICTTLTGKPYPTADALSGVVRRVVHASPDIPNNRSMHGLKYASGSRMIEAGCDIGEIMAILGNRTHQMAVKYSTQRQRAGSAMLKMEAHTK